MYWSPTENKPIRFYKINQHQPQLKIESKYLDSSKVKDWSKKSKSWVQILIGG